jgi:hypothetical protein
MGEINKLRTRLKNVSEAKELLKEIDVLLKQEKPPQQVALNEPTVRTTQIIDGGAFGGP